ncbi:MAG: hypothetical protein R6X35_12225 [Candidatus Krumholzibacteriia bacterium]
MIARILLTIVPPMMLTAALVAGPAQAAERPTGEFAWLNAY